MGTNERHDEGGDLVPVEGGLHVGGFVADRQGRDDVKRVVIT